MDRFSKADKQVAVDVTAELRAAENPWENDAASTGARAGDGVVDLGSCVRHVGGLILRGNRCVLCRSLTGAWNGMRVPSVEPEMGESEATCAVRSVSELCDIDEEEVQAVPGIAPINIYMPGGRPVVVSMHVLYATSAPPDGSAIVQDDDEGPMEEDEEDEYDWYAFPHAVAALDRVGDEATMVALQALAFALKGAARAGALPVKWGGVFGQRFTMTR